MEDSVLSRLADPGCYPESTAPPQIVQTHISVVCITDRLVYKVKKAQRLPFLDLRELGQREHFCREELRLNRRLCPAVYREVIPLCRDAEGVNFRGSGEVVDYAVVMERLPEERMMDRLLRAGEVEEGVVRVIAGILAPFHREHPLHPAPGEPGHPDLLAQFVRDNFTETEQWRGTLYDDALHRAMQARAESDLATLVPALTARIAAGRTVDGHGDLHARNICLTDPPTIYDCLEFSPAMRCGDAAADVAFLVMDLLRFGRRDLADAFVDAYVESSGDTDLRPLLPPLVAYRAMVRAKTSAFTVMDGSVGEAQRADALEDAVRYLQLAAAASCAGAKPVLVAACGLPGSGKSFFFNALAEATRWSVHSTDRVRKERLGLEEEKLADASAYTENARFAVYEEVLGRAAAEVRSTGRSVLLDGTFTSRRARQLAADTAAGLGARLLVVHFDIDEATAIERIRARGTNTASDADEAVYRGAAAAFESPSPEEPVITVSGTLLAATAVDRILSAMLMEP